MDARTTHNRQQACRGERFRAVPRQRLTPLEVAALLLIAIALVYAAVSAPGDAGQADDFDTVTIRVEPSESLWSLAARHPIQGLDTAGTIRVIQEINHMSGASVAAGQLLVVPAAVSGTTALAALD